VRICVEPQGGQPDSPTYPGCDFVCARAPTTWCRRKPLGTPPTKHWPHPDPATPPPCAAACCSCPYGGGGTPTGRPPLSAGGPVRAAPPRPRPRSRPGRMTGRPGRPGARGCAKGCARCCAARRTVSVSCRSPRCFAVVGSLTSPLRLLCPCPLAGVKEEGTGGMGGAAAAGDRGALGWLRVGRGRHASPLHRQPGDGGRDGRRLRPGAVLPVPSP
jgi:hypothetical protein